MEAEKRLYPFLFEAIEDAEEHARVQLADLGYQDSVIRNGWLSADTLSDVMETYMERVVGDDVFDYYGRQFPVCVRTIVSDSRTPLLVCPDDKTAEQRFDFLGKAKLWYVVSVEPDAKVCAGFEREVSSSEFYEACLDGSVGRLLHWIKPSPGDHFLISPGTVHCLSGHVTVCEISESSPLDFRLYGWGEPDPDAGSSLNIETAFDFIDYGAYAAPSPSQDEAGSAVRPSGTGGSGEPAARQGTDGGEVIADVPQFVVTRRRLDAPLLVNGGSAESYAAYSCISGEAAILAGEDTSDPDTRRCVVRPGETALVPADVTRFQVLPLKPDTVLLETTTPPRPQPDSYLS